MSKKLFVGSLPYTTTQGELEELFKKVGTVASVNVIIDRMTGSSKGFAFVEMATEEDAQKAIKELNGTDLGGRKIVVNEAKPQEDRSNRPPRSNFQRSGNRW